jgi:thioredoxin 1
LLTKRTRLIAVLLVTVMAAGVLLACGSAGDRPTLLFFRASNCPYCKQMTPVVEEIGQKYGSKLAVEYVTVDQSKGKELAHQYGIIGYPTILLLDSEGEKAGLLQGVVPRPAIEAAVENLLQEGQ